MKFNFKVGEYVQLYRRQIDPLGGDVKDIPIKGSVGCIVHMSEKYTYVRWKSINGFNKIWAVQPHNLKRITKEFHDNYGEPVKEEEVDNSPYTAFKKKCLDADRLSNFILNGKEYPGQICYATVFDNFPIKEFKVFFPRIKEEHLPYVDFLINESVFKDFFVEKDASKYSTEVVEINTNIHQSYGVLAACVALRSVHEFPSYHKVWDKLVASGVDKNLAILVSQLFRGGEGFYQVGTGHTLIAKITKARLKDFLTGKFNDKARSIFQYVVQEDNSYGKDGCMFYSYMKEKKLIGEDKYGYHEQTKPISDVKLVEICNAIYEEVMK